MKIIVNETDSDGFRSIRFRRARRPDRRRDRSRTVYSDATVARGTNAYGRWVTRYWRKTAPGRDRTCVFRVRRRGSRVVDGRDIGFQNGGVGAFCEPPGQGYRKVRTAFALSHRARSSSPSAPIFVGFRYNSRTDCFRVPRVTAATVLLSGPPLRSRRSMTKHSISEVFDTVGKPFFPRDFCRFLNYSNVVGRC